ncbi:TetR/AcrR family transcriptional regulator [Catelliglobosispora koreensis]|uniref:TetR/AcrR family transcriptional regulator n=1 Tax=Catelliglobosispora koreensis TaxID=129052 RepID=UPI001B7F8C16|nr:TetR/AcrR family transcriptional regulator [Catelliglobosispora koreensis]
MAATATTRRTQAQRASAMRHRLLEATIECLVDYGYAGTSTTKVVERAGVTRGAQVHHFPTKAALVAAALRHLAAKRAEAAFAELDRIRSSPDPIDAALDLMWEMHQGPVFHATVELWVAARTDPELNSQLALVEPATTASVVEVARSLFPAHADQQAYAHCVYTAMDTVRGILLTSFVHADPVPRLEARWHRAKQHLRMAFDAALKAPLAKP